MADWELNLAYPDAQALQRLIDARPAVFRGDLPTIHSHLPPGWYELTHRLFLDIETLLGDEISAFQVRQIKEKYAQLRVYYALHGESKGVIDVISPTSRQRIESSPKGELHERLDALITTASEESERTCQTCSGPGRRRDTGRWLATLCDEHARP